MVPTLIMKPDVRHEVDQEDVLEARVNPFLDSSDEKQLHLKPNLKGGMSRYET